MLFKARVIDNADFVKTGTIRVRIDEFFNGSITDLAADPFQITDGMEEVEAAGEKKWINRDHQAVIYSPIGFGNGYGAFYLPQINSYGMVAMLGHAFDYSYEFVWMGGLSQRMPNGDINIPNDDTEAKNGVVAGEPNIANMNGALVVKLKHTELKDPLKPEESTGTLGFENQQEDNLIVVNKDHIFMHHNIFDEKSQNQGNLVFEMSQAGIAMTYTNGPLSGVISVNDKSEINIIAANSDKNVTSSITSTEDNMQLLLANDTGSSIINLEPESVSLNAGDASMTIDGRNDKVMIDTKGDIEIHAGGKLGFGSGGNYIVTCNNPTFAVNVDKYALTVNPNISC
jgi:hypothetical protein